MSLIARLERPPAPSLPVGAACAVFTHGVCFDTHASVTGLQLRAGGPPSRAAAFNMPRPGLAGEEPLLSGFWGTVTVPAQSAPGAVVLELVAELDDGRSEVAEVGQIRISPEAAEAPACPALPRDPAPALIAVAMATFEPDPSLLRAQLDTLREQTDVGWICVISDDHSGAEHFERLRAEVGEDPRFFLSRSERRLGFYRNFERAIALAPPQAELIALCDQDDRWHQDKLASLREALGEATLAYSDLRLVEASGLVLRPTLWRGRRNNADSLISMLVANSITGAAMLFTREVAQRALPFPDTPGFQFHDHWLALVALSLGELAYVDRPLYDYVQHSGAVFGDVTHGQAHPRTRLPLRELVRARHVRAERWRGAYFYGYLSRSAQAETLLARCGRRLAPGKERALRRFVAAERSPLALAWLALRPLRMLTGRTETLGSESELARGIAWKHVATLLARVRARVGLVPRGLLGESSPPPPASFSQRRLRRWRARM